MTSMNTIRIFSLGIVALAFTAATASANITPIFEGPDGAGCPGTPSATCVPDLITAGDLAADIALDPNVTAAMEGDFLWAYSITLDNQEQIVAGQSKFCIADLTGLIASSASFSTTGFAVSQATTGGCAPLNAGVATPNAGASVSLAYTTGSTVTGGATLGNLYFVSSDGQVGTNNVAFGGLAEFNGSAGKTQGNPTANQGEVEGPLNNTPEPGTLFLMGSVLVGAGLIRKRRKS